jgi:Domain of unknown function (DUF4177)
VDYGRIVIDTIRLARGSEMQTWEYKFLIIKDEIDPDKMLQSLSELGKDGWEVITLIPRLGSSNYIALLKRSVK